MIQRSVVRRNGWSLLVSMLPPGLAEHDGFPVVRADKLLCFAREPCSVDGHFVHRQVARGPDHEALPSVLGALEDRAEHGDFIFQELVAEPLDQCANNLTRNGRSAGADDFALLGGKFEAGSEEAVFAAVVLDIVRHVEKRPGFSAVD